MSSLARLPPTITMFAAIQHALGVAPTVGKYLVILLFLLNAGSWPLVWHFRVFSSVFRAHLHIRLVKLRHLFSSRENKAAALERMFEAHMPVGVHPFRETWTYTSWVSIDDSDFNLHMSNSSYAKALDSARFRLAIATFPNLFRSGGWVPLAATHYHFIREIPMLTRYEVRASIGAWDDKWIWVISRFVNPPSKSKSKKSSTTPTSSTSDSANPRAAEPPKAPRFPTLKTPATPLTSGGSTPLLAAEHNDTASDNARATGHDADADAVAKALLARARHATEPDGALLYTICVSQLCFKQGRITVPPALQIRRPLPSKKYAAAQPPAPPNAPPPHWPATAPLRASMRELRALYAGGWRAVPPAERWWDDALRGCEAELAARRGPFVGRGADAGGGLMGGLEGVRGLVG
ncbi:hypothetical protein B0H17DRAFT_1023848 [Mycena rosella]|uniref:Thioesterase/thiol ester dehydrase-isomerase n=1 Tax=Mycena rosella TaxID=1033263 RepID=A0AAD7FQ69_MYCRO|nr:hypothetical protein B0H17DRAFT_1023848 [Mycena rosella]